MKKESHNIILELWYNSDTRNSLKYKLVTGEIFKAYQALFETFTDEQLKLFAAYTNAAVKQYDQNTDRAFVEGFCKGVTITVQSLSENE